MIERGRGREVAGLDEGKRVKERNTHNQERAKAWTAQTIRMSVDIRASFALLVVILSLLLCA